MKIRFVTYLLFAVFVLTPFVTSATTTPATLVLGSRGGNVLNFQQELVTLNYLSTGNATGYFGTMTLVAVRRFQCKTLSICSGTAYSNGYGAVGTRTKAALDLSVANLRAPAPVAQSTTKQQTPPPTTPPSPVVIVPSCTPLASQTQTVTCADGQIGTITQTRTSSCVSGATSPVWSAWVNTTNTCVTAVVAPVFNTTGKVTVGAAQTVVTNDQISAPPPSRSTFSKMIDSSITTFAQGGVNYWLNSNSIYTSKYSGTVDSPFATLLWNKSTEQVFAGSQRLPDVPDGTVPGYWIVNTYQDTTGLLGIVHTEYPKVTGGVYSTGRTRIGLAWSSDVGEHFSYLGDILVPFTDPVDNVQGAPYIIKDGYLYLYYKDKCNGNASMGATTVARAPLADVISAARQGKVTAWKKYLYGAWASDGLGGDCSAINIPNPTIGINHTDAAYSTFTGKYYLLLSTMNWGGQDTWIKMYESTDGITWTYDKAIVDEPSTAVQEGYQYVSIVDISGSDNGIVGQKFYVYAVKEPALASSVVGRWLIDLGGNGVDSPAVAVHIPVKTVSTYTFSSGYSSTQGGNQWSYLYRVGAVDSPMSWTGAPWDSTGAAKLWQGGEAYTLINQGWMHPGATGDAVLKWTAPRSGTAHITGTALDGNGTCGNGVIVSIMQNGTQLWQQTITNGDAIGKSHDLSVSVQANDSIFFDVNSRGEDNGCDTTNWNPTVELTSVQ